MTSYIVYESEASLRWAIDHHTDALLLGARALPDDVALTVMMSLSRDIVIDDQLMLPIDAVLDAVSDAELKQGSITMHCRYWKGIETTKPLRPTTAPVNIARTNRMSHDQNNRTPCKHHHDDDEWFRIDTNLYVRFQRKGSDIMIDWCPRCPRFMPYQMYRRYQVVRQGFGEQVASNEGNTVEFTDFDGVFYFDPPEVH